MASSIRNPREFQERLKSQCQQPQIEILITPSNDVIKSDICDDSILFTDIDKLFANNEINEPKQDQQQQKIEEQKIQVLSGPQQRKDILVTVTAKSDIIFPITLDKVPPNQKEKQLGKFNAKAAPQPKPEPELEPKPEPESEPQPEPEQEPDQESETEPKPQPQPLTSQLLNTADQSPQADKTNVEQDQGDKNRIQFITDTKITEKNRRYKTNISMMVTKIKTEQDRPIKQKKKKKLKCAVN